MKRSLNPCEKWRESVCLLAGDALSDAEQAELRRHLAGCVDCRGYYDQIRSVTAPLTGWEKNFSRLEPQPGMQARWKQAVLAAEQPKPVRRFSFLLVFQISWRELIRPSRHVWAGMAALWVVLLGINATLSGTPGKVPSARSSTATAFQVFEEQRRVLAELIPPTIRDPIESPRPNHPRPRSANKTRWSMG